jgi:hypothetical protein
MEFRKSFTTASQFTSPAPVQSPGSPLATNKKSGFFGGIGRFFRRFFRRIFGAE